MVAASAKLPKCLRQRANPCIASNVVKCPAPQAFVDNSNAVLAKPNTSSRLRMDGGHKRAAKCAANRTASAGRGEEAWRLASREQPQRVHDRGQELRGRTI